VLQSWVFSGPGRFAQLTLSPVTQANAAEMHALGEQMLHYSPEPRVVEKLVASAALLGRDREGALHLARFRAAFPDAFREWRLRQQQAAEGGVQAPGP
jgi:O-antigen polymerase